MALYMQLFLVAQCSYVLAQKGGGSNAVAIGVSVGGGLGLIIVGIIVAIVLLRRRRAARINEESGNDINQDKNDNTTELHSEVVSNGKSIDVKDTDDVYAEVNKLKKGGCGQIEDIDKTNSNLTISNPNCEHPPVAEPPAIYDITNVSDFANTQSTPIADDRTSIDRISITSAPTTDRKPLIAPVIREESAPTADSRTPIDHKSSDTTPTADVGPTTDRVYDTATPTADTGPTTDRVHDTATPTADVGPTTDRVYDTATPTADVGPTTDRVYDNAKPTADVRPSTDRVYDTATPTANAGPSTDGVYDNATLTADIGPSTDRIYDTVASITDTGPSTDQVSTTPTSTADMGPSTDRVSNNASPTTDIRPSTDRVSTTSTPTTDNVSSTDRVSDNSSTTSDIRPSTDSVSEKKSAPTHSARPLHIIARVFRKKSALTSENKPSTDNASRQSVPSADTIPSSHRVSRKTSALTAATKPLIARVFRQQSAPSTKYRPYIVRIPRKSTRNSDAIRQSVEADQELTDEQRESQMVTQTSGSRMTNLEEDTYYNTIVVKNRKISLDKLPEFVSKKTKHDFTEEFHQLPRGLIKPYLDSQRRENVAMNRYKGIYPYDETRVVLNEGESDYINASFIDGYSKRKAYIAALGPTTRHMGDMSAFWIMIWQERVGKIVILTNLREATGPKCDQYWPELGCSLLYADIQVSCHSEDIYADFTVRCFRIQKGSEERAVTQFHFTAWTDSGTPDDVTSLIEFRQKVISSSTGLDGPIIVHCSAGIGRTGTYIAIDRLTQEGEADGVVDIYACVSNMREQRVNMVQTAEQYRYIHYSVVHTLTFDSKAIESSKFNEYMSSNTNQHLEQKFLQLEATVESRSADETEAVVRNRALTDKNRQGADIPGDRKRPRLYMWRDSESSDYINALYINSYKSANRYLVAQSPLRETVEDFLTLICQEKVACIVCLDPPDTAKNKNAGTYCPTDNHTLNIGQFTVTCERDVVTEQYILRTLKITHAGNTSAGDVEVTHIQFTQWNDDDIPESSTKFLQFINDVDLKCEYMEADCPILVHCLTGAKKSGLFCVVSILLEKIQIDQEISVVNIVRQIKSRRHMAIPNKDQYIFCHECLSEYIQSVNIYSN